MRKFGIFIIVFVITLMGVPFGFGMMVQHKIMSLYASASQPSISFNVLNYKRGVFSSSADIIIKAYDLSGGSEKSVEVTLHQAIKHGPILFSHNAMGQRQFKLGQAFIHTELVMPKGEAFTELFKDQHTKPKASSSTLVNIMGNMSSALVIPPFHYENHRTNIMVDWKGFSGQFNFAKDLNAADGVFKLNGLRFKGDGIQLSISEGKMHYKGGEGEFTLPLIQVVENNTTAFSLHNANVVSRTQMFGDALNTSVIAKFDKLKLDNDIYGPAVYEIAVNGINKTMLDDLEKDIRAASNPKLSQHQQQMLMMSLAPKWARLLQKGASFEVKRLNVATPEGEMKFNARLAFLEGKNTGAGMLQMISKLDAMVNLQIPVTLTQKLMTNVYQNQVNPSTAKQHTNEQLNMWVSSGMLMKEGNFYHFKAQFQNGRLEINGQVMM